MAFPNFRSERKKAMVLFDGASNAARPTLEGVRVRVCVQK